MDNACDSPSVSTDAGEQARRAQFEVNRALFEEFLPAVAQEILAIREPHSRLVAVGDDDWDIEFSGIPLYNRGGREFAEIQQEQWWANPVRVKFSKPRDGNYDRHANSSIEELLTGFEEHGVTPSEDMETDQSFHVICMGIGLGFHLPMLVKRTQCHHLQIIEVNVEFLYHSWHVMDWTPVFRYDNGAPRIVRLSTTLDLEKKAPALREYVRSTNPTRVEGTIVYQHYHNEQYTAVLRNLLQGFGLSLSGLGFLDDEVRMVRNAYLNLKHNNPLIFHKRTEAAGFPALIIGSGPSLDGMIDDVRRNAPHSMVVACGTSLPALLRQGIRPDCFAVLENIAEIYDYVSDAKTRWGLEGITLIASVTVDPRVPPLFERSVLFMRCGLASYPVFCHDPATSVPDSSPTVTNTGFGVSAGLGVKEAYFFGVDLGTKVADRHHSAESPYMADGMDYDGKFNIEVRGNFGGKLLSEYVLNWSRDCFEQSIASRAGSVRVFNCSDGAFIRGTTPRVARTLNLPACVPGKKELLAAFWGRLAPYSADDWARAWGYDRIVDDVNNLRQTLTNILDRVDEDIYQSLYEFNFQLLVPPSKASQHFLRGSLFQIMIVCNYYLNRVTEDQRAKASMVVRSLLKAQLNRFADHTLGFLRDLNNGKLAGDWLIGPDGKPAGF